MKLWIIMKSIFIYMEMKMSIKVIAIDNGFLLSKIKKKKITKIHTNWLSRWFLEHLQHLWNQQSIAESKPNV